VHYSQHVTKCIHVTYIADTLNYKKLNEIYNLRSCTNEMVVEVTYVIMHDTQ